MGFLKSLFSQRMQRDTVLDHFIEKLAHQEDNCEFIKFISFEKAASYMKDNGGQVISTGRPYPEESVVYGVTVGSKRYNVRTSRSVDRAGILLTSELNEG